MKAYYITLNDELPPITIVDEEEAKDLFIDEDNSIPVTEEEFKDFNEVEKRWNEWQKRLRDWTDED